MEIVHILLRLIHIVSGVLWVGLGFTFVVVVGRAAAAVGVKSLPMMKAILTKTPFPTLIAAASGTTTLAGILLYGTSNMLANFTQTGQIVLTIGAAAGLIATIHGGAFSSRLTRQYADALNTHVSDDGAVAEAGRETIMGLQAQIAQHSRISLALMLIALVFMASARYL